MNYPNLHAKQTSNYIQTETRNEQIVTQKRQIKITEAILTAKEIEKVKTL